jgi:hypothetical protein
MDVTNYSPENTVFIIYYLLRDLEISNQSVL